MHQKASGPKARGHPTALERLWSEGAGAPDCTSKTPVPRRGDTLLHQQAAGGKARGHRTAPASLW